MIRTATSNLTLDYYLNDEILLKRHKLSIPPPEAYLFFPNDFQEIEYDEKNPKITLRKIFESKEKKFIKYEEDKMEELNREIEKYNQKNKSENLIIPEDYNIYEIRRFLQATTFDCSKTIQLLKENIEWRKTLIPPKISNKVVELLNCGFMYVHGRDNNYRPILVINADIYMKLREVYIYDDWLSCIIYFMEYLVNHLLIPGQVENWDIITDLTGVSLIFMPTDMKKLMNVLQANYRCRLYINYIIGMSVILRGIWNFIKKFMEETTVKKIRFLTEDTFNEIFEFINEEQVEKKFGGKAPNVTQGEICFPPLMPSMNYLKNSQDKNTAIVSEDKYREMHEQNKLATTGEFFLNKWRREDQERSRIELERQKAIQVKEEAQIYVSNDSKIYKECESSSSSSSPSHDNFKLQIENNIDRIIENEFTITNKITINEMKFKLRNSNSIKNCLSGKEGISDKTPQIINKMNNRILPIPENKINIINTKFLNGTNTKYRRNSNPVDFQININHIEDNSDDLIINETNNINRAKTNEFPRRNNCLIY